MEIDCNLIPTHLPTQLQPPPTPPMPQVTSAAITEDGFTLTFQRSVLIANYQSRNGGYAWDVVAGSLSLNSSKAFTVTASDTTAIGLHPVYVEQFRCAYAGGGGGVMFYQINQTQ